MKIGILGVGLIGGSFALACKKYLKNVYIIGWGRNKERLKKAKQKRIIDKFSLRLEDFNRLQFILVSLPVSHIVKKIKELENIVSEKTIVFDAGSTKLDIYKKLKNIKLNFIPCHPLAGGEKTGFENASASLFVNKSVIITPYKKDKNLKKLLDLFKKIKSIPVICTPQLHDRIMAFTSHLPHFISWSYINSLSQTFDRSLIPDFTGGSFNDFIRIAKSSPELWKDIFITNRKEILRSIKKLRTAISRFEKYIKDNDERKIFEFIKKTKSWISQ